MLDRHEKHYRDEGCSTRSTGNAHTHWGEALLQAMYEQHGDVAHAFKSLHHDAYSVVLRQPVLRCNEYKFVIGKLSEEHPAWADAVVVYAKQMLPGALHGEMDQARTAPQGHYR